MLGLACRLFVHCMGQAIGLISDEHSDDMLPQNYIFGSLPINYLLLYLGFVVRAIFIPRVIKSAPLAK